MLPLSIGDGELARDRRRGGLGAGDISILARRRAGLMSASWARRRSTSIGNINTTGDRRNYDAPQVRLPGAGGAPEIAAARRKKSGSC